VRGDNGACGATHRRRAAAVPPARQPVACPSLFLQGPVAESNAQSEADQEALLRAKYGGLLPKKKLGGMRNQRHFDSADWAMNKQRGAPAAVGAPKLEPTPHPGPSASNLGAQQQLPSGHS
jgi:hypothetical protein